MAAHNFCFKLGDLFYDQDHFIGRRARRIAWYGMREQRQRQCKLKPFHVELYVEFQLVLDGQQHGHEQLEFELRQQHGEWYRIGEWYGDRHRDWLWEFKFGLDVE